MYVGYSMRYVYKQALDQAYHLFGTLKETPQWLALSAEWKVLSSVCVYSENGRGCLMDSQH